jgi:hypothetical protein
MIRSEMMERMAATEFRTWMAFDELEPLSDTRMELHFGFLRMMIANMFGRKTADDPPYRLKEFLPFVEIPEVQLTDEQQLQVLTLMQQIQNAQVQQHG